MIFIKSLIGIKATKFSLVCIEHPIMGNHHCITHMYVFIQIHNGINIATITWMVIKESHDGNHNFYLC